MLRPKNCCIMGDINLNEADIATICRRIKSEMILAIANGYTHFILRPQTRADLLCANIALSLAIDNKTITLEAVFPYPSLATDEVQRLMDHCSIVRSVSREFREYSYNDYCRSVLDLSACLIAVGGETEEIAFALGYAKEQNKEIKII